MGSLQLRVLGDALAHHYGVLLALIVLSIAAKFILVVIALHKAGPEHVTGILREAFRHWWW